MKLENLLNEGRLQFANNNNYIKVWRTSNTADKDFGWIKNRQWKTGMGEGTDTYGKAIYGVFDFPNQDPSLKFSSELKKRETGIGLTNQEKNKLAKDKYLGRFDVSKRRYAGIPDSSAAWGGYGRDVAQYVVKFSDLKDYFITDYKTYKTVHRNNVSEQDYIQEQVSRFKWNEIQDYVGNPQYATRNFYNAIKNLVSKNGKIPTNIKGLIYHGHGDGDCIATFNPYDWKPVKYQKNKSNYDTDPTKLKN